MSIMGRIRFTREQAQHEAVRRASEFVSGLPSYASSVRLRHALPDPTAAKSCTSKHPIAWIVVFASDLPDGAIMDGGELFVAVDLESGVVAIR